MEDREQACLTRLRWAGVVTCAGMASGVVISRPLWLTERRFPLTLPWDALPAPAPPFDAVLLALFLAALGLAALLGRRAIFGACFVLALLLAAPDIQRWQPWFFQYAFMVGALAFCAPRDALGTLRVIMAFIYVYSGLQKIHAAFFDSGMEFFLEPFGLTESLSWASYASPFIELAVGICLLFTPTRTFAATAAVGMHAFLLLALGPLGQDWNVVVWPWNVAMAALVLVLFFRAPDRGFALSAARSAYGACVLLLFAVMPAFGLFGLWPSYLSASLYSENTKSALVYAGEDYVTVSSLAFGEFETPAYPEEAVFMSVAKQACKRHEEELAVRPVMEVFSRPGLLTGETSSRIYSCPALSD